MPKNIHWQDVEDISFELSKIKAIAGLVLNNLSDTDEENILGLSVVIESLHKTMKLTENMIN